MPVQFARAARAPGNARQLEGPGDRVLVLAHLRELTGDFHRLALGPLLDRMRLVELELVVDARLPMLDAGERDEAARGTRKVLPGEVGYVLRHLVLVVGVELQARVVDPALERRGEAMLHEVARNRLRREYGRSRQRDDDDPLHFRLPLTFAFKVTLPHPGPGDTIARPGA